MATTLYPFHLKPISNLNTTITRLLHHRHSNVHLLHCHRPHNPISRNPSNRPPIPITSCTNHNNLDLPISSKHDFDDVVDDDDADTREPTITNHQNGTERNFWGAVTLIIGTAVGPGMLGLPAATIRSGPLPSTIAILLSWVYVVSSIILVAELTFAVMEEERVAEVSFTGLATKAFGTKFGAFVALVYASLSFSLLVACVSGIGSLMSQWFPLMNHVLAHALFPCAVAIVIVFFPFKAIDAANRVLCLLMLISISGLVGIGITVARTKLLSSFGHASWGLPLILPAIPVTVLTLGFHVITPFICRIAGDLVEARKAILFGGAVPLVMVLSWNLIVLGLSGTKTASSSSSKDPISLLLSVNPSVLSAVQGFAFSALATSLIGYTVSFPKQLIDTLVLIFGETKTKTKSKEQISSPFYENGIGRVGYATFQSEDGLGNVGKLNFNALDSEVEVGSRVAPFDSIKTFVTLLVLGVPVYLASFFPSTFSRALDFAGVYANCFLFGILPPLMAYVYQCRKKLRSSILPGGDGTLLALLTVAVILAIWH